MSEIYCIIYDRFPTYGEMRMKAESEDEARKKFEKAFINPPIIFEIIEEGEDD